MGQRVLFLHCFDAAKMELISELLVQRALFLHCFDAAKMELISEYLGAASLFLLEGCN
jgi:hypothetical protein